MRQDVVMKQTLIPVESVKSSLARQTGRVLLGTSIESASQGKPRVNYSSCRSCTLDASASRQALTLTLHLLFLHLLYHQPSYLARNRIPRGRLANMPATVLGKRTRGSAAVEGTPRSRIV